MSPAHYENRHRAEVLLAAAGGGSVGGFIKRGHGRQYLIERWCRTEYHCGSVIVVATEGLNHDRHGGNGERTRSRGREIVVRPTKEHAGVLNAIRCERRICQSSTSCVGSHEAMQIAIVVRNTLPFLTQDTRRSYQRRGAYSARTST